VPRLPDGTVSLEGVWQGGGPVGNLAAACQRRDDPDAAVGQAEDGFAQAVGQHRGELPAGHHAARAEQLSVAPRAVPHAQKATHIFMLFEANIHSFRQIFMDGRKHPPADELDPSWYGHSIGWWEGDTLVIDSIGFNDRGTLDGAGAPQTTKKHVIERWTRKDLGHMMNEITIDDPGAYSRPFKLTFEATLRVGDEIMEYICNENNQYGLAGGNAQ
jgi:hypothetical protein